MIFKAFAHAIPRIVFLLVWTYQMKVVVKVANYVRSFIKVLPSYCELLVLIFFYIFVSTIAMTAYLKYSTLVLLIFLLVMSLAAS